MFDIHRERVYRCSAAVLWRAIATQEGLSAWLMPCDFQPVVGHEFTFRTRPVLGFDGVVHARVLELHEQRRLRLSWRAGGLNTEVVFVIENVDRDHVRLRLEHSGFQGLSNAVARVALGFGWRKLLRVQLSEWVARNGGEPA
jgi:uncharacterized protein YndB with AHSA1/START domain